MSSGPADLPNDLSPRAAACLLLVIALAAVGLRFRLLALPLDRDEGEYAYIGWLMLQGTPPYAEAYTMKLPGIHAAYAGILSVFGQSPAAIRTGLLVANLGAIGLIYLVGRAMFSRLAGVAAAAAYATLSVGPDVHGIIANAEHFVIVPMLAGVWLLVRGGPAPGRLSVIGAGLCLGLAFLIKQPAIAFLVFGLAWLGWMWLTSGRVAPGRLAVNVGLLLAGPLVLFAGVCLWMKASGTFDSFWRWTVEYPLGYAAQVSWSKGVDLFLMNGQPIAIFAWPFLVLGALGVVASFRPERRRTDSAFLAGFGLFSFLAVCPGLHFREHYFLFLLPAVALAAGAAFQHLAFPRGGSRRIVAALVMLAASCGWSIASEREILFRLPLADVARTLYGLNPFTESPAIAAHIAKTTPPDARVGILGSEPQFLFEARRRSATGFLYMYPLTERHRFTEDMQRQMIAEIEAADPELLVVVTVPTSWLYRSDAPRIVFDWMNVELPRRYEMEGLAVVGQGAETPFLWGGVAEAYTKHNPQAVKFLRRRPAETPQGAVR